MDTLLAIVVWTLSGPLTDPAAQPGLLYLKLWTALHIAPKLQGLLRKNESEA